MKNLRILPLTLAAMVLIFGVKVNDIWQNDSGIFFSFEPSIAVAEIKNPPEEGKNEDATDQKNSDTPDKEKMAQSEEHESKSSSSMVGTQDFSDSEIEILEKLAARRASLEKRSAALDLRDNLLIATETKIDEKIAALKKIEATIKNLLFLHDKQEKTQMKRLVTMYEKMKPKQAARIFNELEMDILLNIASMMKESKMAAVLSAMRSDKANELTVEMATRSQLPGDKKTKS